MMSACKTGNLELVKFLMERTEYDLKAANNEHKTVIHFACELGKIDLVDILITKKNLEVQTKDGGQTVLHYACDS